MGNPTSILAKRSIVSHIQVRQLLAIGADASGFTSDVSTALIDKAKSTGKL